MRNQLSTLLFCFLCLAAFGQQGEEDLRPPVKVPEQPARPESEISQFCDIQPEFPGGRDSLRAYLARNIVYPEHLRGQGYNGKCYVQFTVQKTGAISGIIIQRGAFGCPECDQEVIRVIRSMPQWIPGKIGAKPADSIVTLPVAFSSQ